jgi:hypothetical protein
MVIPLFVESPLPNAGGGSAMAMLARSGAIGRSSMIFRTTGVVLALAGASQG